MKKSGVLPYFISKVDLFSVLIKIMQWGCLNDGYCLLNNFRLYWGLQEETVFSVLWQLQLALEIRICLFHLLQDKLSKLNLSRWSLVSMLLCVLERFRTLRAESQGNRSSAAGLWEQKVLQWCHKRDGQSKRVQTFRSVLQDVLTGHFESELNYGFKDNNVIVIG